MTASEHIEWFVDNVRWYQERTIDEFDVDVPACPGWSVEGVINHLSFGLGLAYPAAIAAAPDAPDDRVFHGLQWPSELPRGADAMQAFSTNMERCIRRFRAVSPRTSCWTYAGPGVAAFWFRRAAIETSLHRMDVAEALGLETRHLSERQGADAIVETIEFALPLAGRLTRVPVGELVVDAACLPAPVSIGSGPERAVITGGTHEVVNALWGRRRDDVDVDGDRAVADGWLAAIETAFAGR